MNNNHLESLRSLLFHSQEEIQKSLPVFSGALVCLDHFGEGHESFEKLSPYLLELEGLAPEVLALAKAAHELGQRLKDLQGKWEMKK